MGSVAAWSAKTGEDKIIDASRDHFYFRWKSYDEKLDISESSLNQCSIGHNATNTFDLFISDYNDLMVNN